MHAQRSRQRAADPHRPGNRDGGRVPPLLAAGGAERGTAGTGRRAAARADPGRGPAGFRSTDGTVGVVSPRCPHRGADLFFGRNEGGGITCAYHGWKFATDGRCLAIPTMEPGAAREKAERNVRLLAYPVHEAGGFVWTYLGPREPDAGPAAAGVPDAARVPRVRFQEAAAVQLGAGMRGRAGYRAFFLPAHAGFRREGRDGPADGEGFVGYGYRALDARGWRAAVHHPGASGGAGDGGGAAWRRRQPLLARQPVPDAEPWPGTERLPGRELSWPVLGADR